MGPAIETKPEAETEYSWTTELTQSHKLVDVLNRLGILQRYFTINIDNSESRFLPAEKLVQFYGAVSLVSPEYPPKCSKCGVRVRDSSDPRTNPYIECLKVGKVLKCKEESKQN